MPKVPPQPTYMGKYAAAPQCAIRQHQDETSLLYALAAVSFNSYTQSHLELPRELQLTEQELLLRAARRVARAHAKEIGVFDDQAKDAAE